MKRTAPVGRCGRPGVGAQQSSERKTFINEKGEQLTLSDHANVQRSRFRFDARRWYASKLNPKKYADKVQQEIMGSDGGPVQTSSVVQDVRAQLEQMRAKMRATIEQAEQAAPCQTDRIDRPVRDWTRLPTVPACPDCPSHSAPLLRHAGDCLLTPVNARP